MVYELLGYPLNSDNIITKASRRPGLSIGISEAKRS